MLPVDRRTSEQSMQAPATARRNGRNGGIGVPHALQQSAIRQLMALSAAEPASPSIEEVRDIAAGVVASVLAMKITPSAGIDSRAQSALGRRLLDAIRDHLMRDWRSHGIKETQLPVLLLAIARGRAAPANRGAHRLVAPLGGSAGLDLLAEVAHDMHSPLASILVLADTLQREESGPLTEMQRRQLGLISTAALGLSSVGRDIIDLTRSEMLLEPKPIPFSVTSVLESVNDIVRPIAEVKRLQVRLAPPCDDERLGHPGARRGVLVNLTANALKFTEDGFVELSTSEP